MYWMREKPYLRRSVKIIFWRLESFPLVVRNCTRHRSLSVMIVWKV